MRDFIVKWEWLGFLMWAGLFYLLINQYYEEIPRYVSMDLVWATYLAYIVVGVFYLERDNLIPDENIKL